MKWKVFLGGTQLCLITLNGAMLIVCRIGDVCMGWCLSVSHLLQVLVVAVFVAWYVSAFGPLSISKTHLMVQYNTLPEVESKRVREYRSSLVSLI